MDNRLIYSPKDELAEDAVTIRVQPDEDGHHVAEVIWPANGETLGGDYLYATRLPLAIERARDVQMHYGFANIVVVMSDPDHWNPKWETLIECPGHGS